MTIPRKTPVRKMSPKREAAVRASGKVPFSTILGERKPVKKKKRSAEEQRRIYGSPEFQAYLHAHECLGCGYRGESIQQAHLFNGGKGRKDDWQRTAPLCGPRLVQPNQHCWREDYMTVGCHTKYDEGKRSEFAASIRAKHPEFIAKYVSVAGAREGGV